MGLQHRRWDPLHVIGLDEVSRRKGQQYLTIVYDHARGRVVWVGRDRSAVTMGVAAAAALSWHPAGALLGLVPAARVAAPSYRRLLNLQKGAVGERSVVELLGRLPDEYVLLNDVVLPGHRGNIDHILIGPCGVVVIETKRWTGKIACVRDRWFVSGFPRPSVTRQVISAAVAVRECLGRGGAGAPGWVEAVVVFTHPLCRLALDRPTPRVVRFSQVMDYVAARSRPPKLTRHSAEALGRILLSAASPR